MDKQDKERREEFKRYEMEKEHKRREHLSELDEKTRKEEELKLYQRLVMSESMPKAISKSRD